MVVLTPTRLGLQKTIANGQDLGSSFPKNGLYDPKEKTKNLKKKHKIYLHDPKEKTQNLSATSQICSECCAHRRKIPLV